MEAPLTTNPEAPPTPLPPQPLTPPTTPTSKPPTILIFALLILAVAAASFLLGKYSLQNKTPTPTAGVTPRPTLFPTPTPDLTADWKTYTNEAYSFQIKYPPDWGYNLESSTATKTKFFMGLWPESAKPKTEKIGPSIISIYIEDYRLSYTDIDSWWKAYQKYISTPIDIYAVDQKKDADKWYEIKKILIDQKPALYLTSTSYYPFRPHKKAVVLNKNNEAIEITIETAPDNPYLPFFDQILSTFKFLDQSKKVVIEPSVTTFKKINILSTAGWKTVYQNGVSFKIPQEANCKQSPLDTNDNEKDCRNIFFSSNQIIPQKISVTEYSGGSRREQYLGKDTTDCRWIFEDALFGNVKALQIALDPGWCQGGGGAIVAVIGDKFISLSDLAYNPETKVIERNVIKDTIISTLKKE